ncbi:hypothetical protein CTAYLR_000597 [Chrysophaeum taylorii]|uniref:Xanthine dehydrogenase n=1 Tax=Chrysophaeum taylorii TaxID=2483200 RepID=A0AAD7UHU4_9STRA|nr:hypothetical protein CTAYLR_000597 [Chrysophaeum taylorii]
MGLTGTKLGCGEGGCGACTVIVSSPDGHASVNSCLAPLCSVDGLGVTTVEGSSEEIQRKLAEAHGSQCGACTPGFVMALQAKAINKAEEKKNHHLDGNLCRCTGYRSILSVDIEECGAPPCVPEFRNSEELEVKGKASTWHRPTTLARVLALKRQFPDAKLITGNTEVGIEMRTRSYATFISLAAVPELGELRLPSIGGAVTLAKLREAAYGGTDPGYLAMGRMLDWFASTQIRNVASLAGNVATASPISDMNPLLVCLEATIVLANCDRERRVLARDFFVGYRKTAMDADEIIVRIEVPESSPGCLVEAYKQCRRREDDISIVCCAFKLKLDEGNNNKVVHFTTGFGGMAPTTIAASKTEARVKKNMAWPPAWDAYEALKNELWLPPDAPGGMPEYRVTLCCSFLRKFAQGLDSYTTVPRRRTRPLVVVKSSSSSSRSGGGGVMHRSALLQASGKASYADDLPSELHAALVLTTKPHANFKVQVPANVVFFGAADVADNRIGAVLKDEELFATTKATSTGQPIGVVVAASHKAAVEAARSVKVIYAEEFPSILSIDEAIEAGSYFGGPRELRAGVDFEEAPYDVEVSGDVYIGGQEHFYLEPNSSICTPTEEGMKIVSSTQNPTKTQIMVASVLGLPAAKVTCSVKRLGGGFGGKETRSCFVCCAAAVAAHKLNRSVKITLDRDVDMAITGGRHPFKGTYRAKAKKDMTITAVDATLYCNAGFSLDLSQAVMDRAIFHSENAYRIPNFRVRGYCCKTNTPSNTAFRGFGGPQGMFVCETWVDHLARELGVDPTAFRLKNLYKVGDRTPYGQLIEDEIQWPSVVARPPPLLLTQHPHKKRGWAALPVKFGIAFTSKFLNQGGALVHLYTDGSLLVTHGGTEMGQGLHTKVIQVVADAFEVPLEDVHVEETATDKVANTSPTAASMSTDLYAMAALDASEQILERLRPYDAEAATLRDRALKAHLDRVDLTAHGFHVVPEDRCGYDWDTRKGQPFNYFTSGVGAAEVEIDVLTGDSHVRKVDVVMDLGKSINEAIDVGQIEGAFAQGFGLFTMEDVARDDTSGRILTTGPGTYKIPSANDAPLEFNITLLDGRGNKHAVHSSRAVGEPPLFLGASVFFAIRDAITQVRRDDHDHHPYFTLDSPLTAERIRMACVDDITALVAPPDFRAKGSF